MVSVGRALLVDPYWVEKVRQNSLWELVNFSSAAYYPLTKKLHI
jgi:2,4-dienoyl-CoA reductase-like NADH-dependent reductase (Old Yellow Enzyme family)